MRVLYKEMDRNVNRWLGSVAGVPINITSATFLRCEFGVLPSQLVAERNALYYLAVARTCATRCGTGKQT